MRTQIWIIGSAFIVFGIIAWVVTTYSPSYIGLIGVGTAAMIIGAFSSPK